MKVAIVGSRNLKIFDIEKYLPKDTTEIVSGGAKGIDTCAKVTAQKMGIKITEIFPEYRKYGKCAPIKRNLQIIEYSDEVIAFWDMKSRGTKNVIDTCKKLNKKITVHIF
ncbi:MAG: hypothetical protein IKT44_03690 [Clostridia bacterium]|nr:hypothetical protein [Clostridia bacterium]